MSRADDLKNVIFEIENSDVQKVKKCFRNEAFELRPDEWLLNNLSGNCGALFIRAMLHELNCNEHHVFKWRLENKFKQYQIFNYYAPGSMPETLGFSELLNQNNGIRKIKNLFSRGFFLKATLGDASLSNKSWDKTEEFVHILKLPNLTNGKYECYMLQKKLSLKFEFRVHTFSKEIIPALSYIVQGEKPTVSQFGAEIFIEEILHRLPDAILQGTLIAWDIGLTDDNHYYIIEANFTGFHPEYRAGFQTTGYADDHYYGAIICAWLNTYFHKIYGTYLDAIEDSLFINYPFYKSFIFYMSIFKNEHIDLVKKSISRFSAIIYLGEDTNSHVLYLIKHFLLVDFAKIYCVIVKQDCFSTVCNLFEEYNQVQIWSENWLFTKDQHLLIKQLGYDRRKQACCYHALRRLNDKSCVII